MGRPTECTAENEVHYFGGVCVCMCVHACVCVVSFVSFGKSLEWQTQETVPSRTDTCARECSAPFMFGFHLDVLGLRGRSSETEKTPFNQAAHACAVHPSSYTCCKELVRCYCQTVYTYVFITISPPPRLRGRGIKELGFALETLAE